VEGEQGALLAPSLASVIGGLGCCSPCAQAQEDWGGQPLVAGKYSSQKQSCRPQPLLSTLRYCSTATAAPVHLRLFALSPLAHRQTMFVRACDKGPRRECRNASFPYNFHFARNVSNDLRFIMQDAGDSATSGLHTITDAVAQATNIIATSGPSEPHAA